MQDRDKTKKRLIAELESLRQQLGQATELLAERHKAEEALKDERDLSSALLDVVGALVVVLDREGRIIRFNRACEETTGYSFAEVKNKPLWDIFLTLEESDGVRAVFHHLLSGDLPNTHENYWVARDGSLRLIAWSSTGLVKDGQVEFVIGTGIDITERDKVERHIAHIASFPQLNPNPILEVDQSGSITFYNVGTLKALERLGSGGLVEAFLPEDIGAILKAAQETGTNLFKREVWIGDSIFAEDIYFSANPNVARIYTSDITERKQAEEALRRINAELEQRVAARTEELEETVAQLEEEVSDRQKAESGLQAERQRLYEVLERIPAHVSLLRPDYTFAFVNGEFKRRFGDPGTKRCYELKGRQLPCAECQGMQVFHTRTPVVWEWPGPEGRYYQNFHYPFTDSDGSPLVLEMGIDITKRKQAEKIMKARLKLLKSGRIAFHWKNFPKRPWTNWRRLPAAP